MQVKAIVRGSLIKEKERGLLKLAQFFDVTQVGAEVVDDKAGVKVEKVAMDTAFAKAGLRPGDRVIAINSVKVSSADEFRRLLRMPVFEKGNATLEIQRGESRSHIEVRF